MTSGLISHIKQKKGFTIVELLVVIGVIGVLATIVVVGYGAWKKNILASQVQSDLNGIAAAMENAKNFSNGYPSTLPSTITPSTGVALNLQSTSSTQYCIDATTTGDATVTYFIASELKDKGAQTGTCATDRPGSSSLATPSGLGILSFTATQVSLTWTATAGALSYTLQCATDASYINGAQTATVNSPSTTGTVTGLQSVSTHFCRIKATNASGDSGYSANVKADTSTYLPPTGVAASGNTNTTFTLSWTANADASGYTAQCATDTGFTSPVGFTTTNTSGQFNGLTPNTTYYCHVNATNTTGTPSAYGLTVTTATTANFGTIAAATGLTEVSPGPASGNFSWTGISCSLGTAEYRLTWVSPQTTSTSWSAATTTTAVTYVQQTSNTWKVESRCVYSPLTSSTTSSSNKSFTSVGTAAPTGAFGTIGWNGRFRFDTNANTYTCVSPATEQYQLVSTSINGTVSTISYGWTGTTAMTITGVNQGSQMITYIQVRCLYNAIASSVTNTSSRTDNASIGAPGTVPGWCAGTCGSPRGDRWSAVTCPTGTTAYYWSYAVGNYSNAVWGAYEAAGFYGYDRGYYSYGDTMVNDYLKARCVSSYTTSGYGPQSYAYY